jgi:hypothetical protein
MYEKENKEEHKNKKLFNLKFKIRGLVFSDEPGLGKTASILSYLKLMKLVQLVPTSKTHEKMKRNQIGSLNNHIPTMIFCPNHMCQHWWDQSKMWCSPYNDYPKPTSQSNNDSSTSLVVMMLRTKNDHKNINAHMNIKRQIDILIVSTSFLHGQHFKKNKNFFDLKECTCDRIVLDEGHECIGDTDVMNVIFDIQKLNEKNGVKSYGWYVSATPFSSLKNTEMMFRFLGLCYAENETFGIKPIKPMWRYLNYNTLNMGKRSRDIAMFLRNTSFRRNTISTLSLDQVTMPATRNANLNVRISNAEKYIINILRTVKPRGWKNDIEAICSGWESPWQTFNDLHDTLRKEMMHCRDVYFQQRNKCHRLRNRDELSTREQEMLRRKGTNNIKKALDKCIQKMTECTKRKLKIQNNVPDPVLFSHMFSRREGSLPLFVYKHILNLHANYMTDSSVPETRCCGLRILVFSKFRAPLDALKNLGLTCKSNVTQKCDSHVQFTVLKGNVFVRNKMIREFNNDSACTSQPKRKKRKTNENGSTTAVVNRSTNRSTKKTKVMLMSSITMASGIDFKCCTHMYLLDNLDETSMIQCIGRIKRQHSKNYTTLQNAIIYHCNVTCD